MYLPKNTNTTFSNSIRNAINRDKHSISIFRSGKIDSGEGYMKTIKETLPIQYGRLYPVKASNATIVNTQGMVHKDYYFRLLCDKDFDIQSSPQVTDVLTTPLGTFNVLAIHPYTINGTIVGYQVELEKVTNNVIR